MINLSQALGQPTIFIRFNPYNYRKGNIIIKDDGPKYRHYILKRWLDYCIQMSIDTLYDIGFCGMVKLFYADFDESNINFETLLAFDETDNQ